MKKLIKGRVWIHNNVSLVQESAELINGRKVENSAEVLISDIWEDLKSASGQWKQSTVEERYFYWEYNYTNAEKGFVDEVARFECPRPTREFFEEIFSSTDVNDWDIDTLESDWAKYWAKVEKEIDTNYSQYGLLEKKKEPSQYTNWNDWTAISRNLGGSGLLSYKDTVASTSDLDTTNVEVGDAYFVQADSQFYAWNGTSWKPLGSSLVDLSPLQNSINAHTTRLTQVENKVTNIEDDLSHRTFG